jgi:Rrf2 family protein
MAQLACHAEPAEPVGLRHVAEATGLPWRYLEQITRPLRKAALIKGRAGRTGGYVLARPPEKITLRDVIEAASGPICLMDCVDSPEACEHSGGCLSRNVWLALTEDIRAVLGRYTLCDLARRPCAGCREAAELARLARVDNHLKIEPMARARARANGAGRKPAKDEKQGASAKPAGRRADARARHSIRTYE